MRITRAAVKAGIVLLASTAALVGMTTSASAATGDDGFSILDASAGNQAHVCEILGTDDDYHEAIVCVDINTKVSGDQVLIQRPAASAALQLTTTIPSSNARTSSTGSDDTCRRIA